MHPFLDAPLPLAFSHRGFAPDGLENSMSAFRRALALGFRYVETDVRATSDGVLLTFHDARLERLTDGHGRIADEPWRKVRSLRIGGVERIPTLEDVLAAFPHARFNVDVKAWSAVGPLVELLRRTNSADRVCVASFSDRRLAAVRRALGPDVATSLGPRGTAALRAAASGRLPPLVARQLAPTGAVAAQVPERAGPLVIVDTRFVAAAHRFGLQVHVWTVNSAERMHRLLDLGVDGIVTDRADTLREVLRARGRWAG